ncbi:MAG: DNA polymerase III subunit beta [Eubacteriales bacterium]|nr:DNA polymerase III subunit beta [Eubacteriales bacterium]
MRLEFSPNELREAINVVMRTASTRSTIEALSCILIRAEENAVRFYSYNLECGSIVRVKADIFEEGAVAVQARLFQDIVRKLPNENVSLSTNDDQNKLQIVCGFSKFEIPFLRSDDFPEMPRLEISEREGCIRIPEKVLAEMIHQTLFSAASDNTRRLFNSLFFNFKEDCLDVVALDGYRLAFAKYHFNEEQLKAMGDVKQYSVVIPAESMAQLAPIMDAKEDEEAYFELSSAKNKVCFENPNIKIISSTFEGEYVDYQSLIPNEYLSQFTINRHEFLAALDRALLMRPATGRLLPVRFQVEEGNAGHIKIESATELGTMKDQVAINFSGEYFDIDFNPTYFTQALKAISDDEILIRCNGVHGPLTIAPTEGDAYLYLLLPVRR